MESLNLDSQPKATFTMSQAPSSSSSSSSTVTSTANQDYSTVNLSDLQEFFPIISSTMVQEPTANQGSMTSSRVSSSFTLQGSQFRAASPLLDDEIQEFLGFSENQAPSTLDILNMDDFEDLLNPRLMNKAGNGTSMLAQASCQQAAIPSSSNAAQNNAVSQNTSDPASNPGSTWMNYPNSIVTLLQNEDRIDITSNNNHHRRPPMLDEFDELMSAEEDRLISFFNSESQAGFVSGHPT